MWTGLRRGGWLTIDEFASSMNVLPIELVAMLKVWRHASMMMAGNTSVSWSSYWHPVDIAGREPLYSPSTVAAMQSQAAELAHAMLVRK
jgi:hypothetical protein